MRKLYPWLNVYTLLAILTVVAGWFVACEEKEDFVPMKIFSVEPAEALIGDTIRITGEGFSPGLQYNHVFFPGVANFSTPHDRSSEQELWIVVPEGAQSGPVTVNLFDEEVVESPALTVLTPVIESVEPAEGLAGDTIVIRGRNFRPEKDRNAVRFNPLFPTAKATVVSGSRTELVAVVPVDSRTGKLSILGIEGADFTILPPAITRVEPLQGIVGDTITIFGRGFNTDPNTTEVLFSGSTARATILTGSTSRMLKVVINENAKDGEIAVRYFTTTLSSGESFTVYPSVTDIVPKNGISGMTITINGYGFNPIPNFNIVKFGGLSATVTSATTRQLRVVVPAGSDSGPITVEVNGREMHGESIEFEITTDGTPLIFELSPDSGPVASTMSIKGDYFSTVPHENIVRFNSDSIAEVLSATKTLLTVKVPYGAANGPVTVTKEGKTGTGPNFTLTSRALPFITSISPEFVEPGDEFTINGGNFTEYKNDLGIIVSGVGSNNTKPLAVSACNSGAIVTCTKLTAVMPSNLPAGEYPINVQQYGDVATGTVTIARTPVIESISPTEATAGGLIVISGQNFHNIDNKNVVKFGNTVALVTNGSSTDRNKITVQVPDMIRGSYRITVTAYGDKTSNNDKTFLLKGKPTAVKDVYYARRIGSATTTTVEKAFYDGESVSTPQTIFSVSTTGSNYVRSLVLDMGDQKAYYLVGSGTAGATIGWSKFDNSAGGTLTTTGAVIQELSLDPDGEKLYYSRSPRTIFKTPTNAFAETSVYPGPASTSIIRGLTYSPEDGRVYFCEQRTAGTRIASINSNASGTDTTTFGLVSPMPNVAVDVKVDHQHKKLFILCGSGTSITNRRRIWVADLNEARTAIVPGTLTEFLSIETETMANINGVALDIQDQYVYWLKQTSSDPQKPSGVYRKRYDSAPIPGSDPTGGGNDVVVELLYRVDDQSPANRNSFGGLAIGEGSGGSSSHRKKGVSSLRISLSGSGMDFDMYSNEKP